MQIFYDKELKPITPEKWSLLHQDLAYRVLGRDTVGRVELTSVWLGSDQAYSDIRGGEMKIFGSMLYFKDKEGREGQGGEWGDYEWLSASETECVGLHKKLKEALESGMSGEDLRVDDERNVFAHSSISPNDKELYNT